MKLELYYIFFTGISFIYAIETATYNYLNKGSDWTGLCSSGTEQSPIDIDSGSVSKCNADMILDINWVNLDIYSETLDNSLFIYLIV